MIITTNVTVAHLIRVSKSGKTDKLSKPDMCFNIIELIVVWSMLIFNISVTLC